MTVSVKYSSLLIFRINYDRKKFYRKGPWGYYSFEGFGQKKINQCLYRERFVTQLCLQIWLGGMPALLAPPKWHHFGPGSRPIDLKRITRYNLGDCQGRPFLEMLLFWGIQVMDFKKLWGSRNHCILSFQGKTTQDNSVTEITFEFSISHRKHF
jgi:hypothetical protein